MGADNTTPGADGADARRQGTRLDDDELFGPQPAATSELPDPGPIVENLARYVIEIIAGARDLEQIVRWVDESVYTSLLKRVVMSAQARHATGRTAMRPMITLGAPQLSQPRDGVVEAVIIARGRGRVRAVAIRLEGLDHRWRATAVHVL